MRLGVACGPLRHLKCRTPEKREQATMSRASRFAGFNLDPALVERVETSPPDEIVEGILRLEDSRRIPPHFTVVSRFDRICTGRFPAAHAWTIRRHPNVKSLKAARPLGISDEDEGFEAPSTREVVQNPRAAPSSPGGTGCIVAALDFGLDFGHPNFLNADGTTRVLAFWHQGAPYDRAHANTYGYGRIFTREELNAALRAPDPYRALGYHPSISDTGAGSHGTHTLDIAAGNGRAQGSRSAPASAVDLIFVHLSTPSFGLVGDLGDSVRMLEGLDYVDKTARGRPWVLNLSVGRTAGSHDGTSLVEQGMHELLRKGPGRAIVQSAGNYRAANLHVDGWLRDGERRAFKWLIDPSDTTPNELDIWYSGKDRFVIGLRPPSGPVIDVELGSVAEVVHDGAVVGRIYHRRNDPNNGDNHGEVFLYPGAPAGTWMLQLIGEYVINGRFHAWIERDVARPGAQSRFDPTVASSSYTLGTIATSPLVITVGAYDPHDERGALAPFSSCGPTRDERRDKPEMLAPGVRVLAARSIPRGAPKQQGLLIARSGTSMAAPHVTGAVAAMVEAAGRALWIDEIRDGLSRSAQPVAGGAGNCCAWGRLDTAAAIQRVRAGRPQDLASTWFADDIEGISDEGAIVDSNAIDRILDRIEQALRKSQGSGRRSEAAFLQRLLSEVDGKLTAPGNTPAELLRSVLSHGRASPMARGPLEVLALPSQHPKDSLRPGDWLLRAVPGTGDVGHVSVLASGELRPSSALASDGIAAEGLQPGLYGLVIEAGAFPHDRSQPFARRMLDRGGCALPNTAVLRPRYFDLGAQGSDWVQRPATDFKELEQAEEGTGCPITDDVELGEQAAAAQPAGPDSLVADRFVAAHASRYCTPGQAGSATCRSLAAPRSIRRVVIHALAVPSTVRRSGVEAVVAGWQHPGRVASAHYLVDRDGTITQMVRESDVAFHTPGNNRDSIGIEHADVCNDPEPLTTQLYERSAALVRDLAARHGFPINPSTVAGHSQVNPNHGDPGPYWDWEYFFLLLAWSGTAAATRPIRLVTSAAKRQAAPAGWQVRQRRAIADDRCASRHDPWGSSYWRLQPSTSSTPAEVAVVVQEAGTHKVSLWWPHVAKASSAVLVDVDVTPLGSPGPSGPTQSVTVDQRTNSGRWNDVAVVTVNVAPAEVRVRWSHTLVAPGWILVDAVRLLKIASRPQASTGEATTEETLLDALSPSELEADWDSESGWELQAYPAAGGQPVLRIGSKGEAVRQLQTTLNTYGLDLAVDGNFGGGTHRAVVVFQHMNFLTPDGIVGPQTWGVVERLQRAAPAPTSPAGAQAAAEADDTEDSPVGQLSKIISPDAELASWCAPQIKGSPTLLGQIFFPTNGATLDDADKKELDKLVDIIAARTTSDVPDDDHRPRITFAGSADPRSTTRQGGNKVLAADRAANAYRYVFAELDKRDVAAGSDKGSWKAKVSFSLSSRAPQRGDRVLPAGYPFMRMVAIIRTGGDDFAITDVPAATCQEARKRARDVLSSHKGLFVPEEWRRLSHMCNDSVSEDGFLNSTDPEFLKEIHWASTKAWSFIETRDFVNRFRFCTHLQRYAGSTARPADVVTTLKWLHGTIAAAIFKMHVEEAINEGTKDYAPVPNVHRKQLINWVADGVKNPKSIYFQFGNVSAP